MQPFIFNTPSSGLFGQAGGMEHYQQKHAQMKQAIMQSIMGNYNQPAPRTIAEGAVQGVGHIIDGLQMRQANRGPFPDAPDGGQASWATGLMNLFGNNGGLY
ncbi:hypothetical protein JQ506_22935 [Shinella sp. PSBB067]|uniref:hypothetical protein n=1 Tax=Shinella sp. PSBB067 TaxID=2715959 RepID=UPI00193C1E2B|nr:hypothetical protein [Shinella sp. PSBB067]QRI63617.1 hypothetical protein JQ506_22935 [Shinella sp. PSBB067]